MYARISKLSTAHLMIGSFVLLLYNLPATKIARAYRTHLGDKAPNRFNSEGHFSSLHNWTEDFLTVYLAVDVADL